MKNFEQAGSNLTIPAPAAVVSGGVVIAGEIRGIAAGSAAIGAKVDVVTTGVFRLPKVAADNITLGAAVYYDAGESLVTIDDAEGANVKLGVAVEAAAATTGSVAVRLSAF
ncbi:DUF2190 family protein [Rhodovulum tesquicola]|uniref:capsid cement protein n=1 Tax=Rhodovulum tesquicola TaxID=540254 RepID=UPI0020985A92|nr:capsid cement protein [Rhodovulum tesquicola]MCO8146917.1 DUF2190 family protein [Rhodovulum tesquicola]